jgi:hypothetical protein
VRGQQHYNVGQVREQYSDGSAYLEWLNTKDGAADPLANWYPAFKDADTDLGESYKMDGDQGKRLVDLFTHSQCANVLSTSQLEVFDHAVSRTKDATQCLSCLAGTTEDIKIRDESAYTSPWPPRARPPASQDILG